MDTSTNLLERQPDAVIARVAGRPVTTARFLGQVEALAEALPTGPHAINLCRDRYRFLLSFCAVIVRGHCNLLLPNDRIATQGDAQRRFEGAYLLHDGCDLPPGPAFDLGKWALPERVGEMPQIQVDRRCALSFTSGSTGDSSIVAKSWGTIWHSTGINRDVYLDGPDQTCGLVATVPAQHMWGLETSIFLPLRAPVAIHPGRPLFPVEVADALFDIEPPRVLVTTPVHIRALLASEVSFPRVDRILCATAPLDADTAARMERRFGSTLVEIYGCSEAGSLASRETARHSSWRMMPAFRARPMDSGLTQVDADHLPEAVVLQDLLEWQDRYRFRLLGRSSDLVNIAGKRASLQELNRLLLCLPGVQDGVIFEPADEGDVVRLAALVVAPGQDASDVSSALRSQLDSAFVPRPLYLVDKLPRNETGKLPRQALLKMLADLRRS